jgi:hypothetical protein
MRKLIAALVGAILLFTTSPCGAIWLDKNHWVDEHLALKFEGNTVHVWQVMPEFGGRMYIGRWTKKEAMEYIDWWYYMHSI